VSSSGDGDGDDANATDDDDGGDDDDDGGGGGGATVMGQSVSVTVRKLIASSAAIAPLPPWQRMSEHANRRQPSDKKKGSGMSSTNGVSKLELELEIHLRFDRRRRRGTVQYGTGNRDRTNRPRDVACFPAMSVRQRQYAS